MKPGNVMLTSDNRCLLTDFGIAKLMGDATVGHTASGFTMGNATRPLTDQIPAATRVSAVPRVGRLLLTGAQRSVIAATGNSPATTRTRTTDRPMACEASGEVGGGGGI